MDASAPKHFRNWKVATLKQVATLKLVVTLRQVTKYGHVYFVPLKGVSTGPESTERFSGGPDLAQNWDFSGFLAVSGLSFDRLIYNRQEWHSRIKALLSARSGISADGPVVEIPNF